MRAREVVKGECARQVAWRWTDSEMRYGVMGGRHGVEPDAMNCGSTEWEKGRGYGTEISLSVSRCQKRTGNVKRMKQIRKKNLNGMARGVIQLLERTERNVKELEARLSRGTTSSSIFKRMDCRVWTLGQCREQETRLNRSSLHSCQAYLLRRLDGLRVY
jgi:hypothetical protein